MTLIERFSNEAVGVDVDADPDLAAPVEGREPVADHVLHVEATAGMDQQALAMTAAKHGERSRGGAKDRHAVDPGRGVTDAAGDRFGFGRVFGRIGG